MSFTLTSTFDDDRFEYEGKVFHVEMAFDNILRLFEMFDDDSLLEWEKILWALEILVFEYDELREISFEEQFELFKFLMKEFLEIDLDKPSEEQKKIMDYKKDAELIYASFFAVYKIDLFEMHGKLHWKKFQALLTHLDDNSPFKQAIGYRTMKVPTAKEASKEYIQHVRKMKQLYALEDEQRNADDVFDTLAQTFKAGAKVVKQDG
ncbi:Gp15 family bacteriophage protein [Peribacillus tepidiphilus]|uniref:Gp15 family bacteriophage protein n=1 Tax=Peribacillus tepidiphilus TaxID=2652445 RepID=UPI001291F00F|nr:Gp15 family bacteriophage protein [Peribacillus tepidiphilus]